MMMESKYHQTIRTLSDRLVNAQRPIRILDALKWDASIEAQFFAKKCVELPRVLGPEYYQAFPLKFEPQQKIDELRTLETDIRRELGPYNGVGAILQRMCREYCTVVAMLQARGTPNFSAFSRELYGSPKDAFYAGAPTLKDLAVLITDALLSIETQTESVRDTDRYTSEEAVVRLGNRLSQYFQDEKEPVRVILNDEIVADAAAGAECIKLRRNAIFSERELRMLEVHEGWVHLGTTLNGMHQPICTFLSKGPPSATVTQEGLAIIMEIFTFSSYPSRMQHLTDRIIAIDMAEQGANFLEVFRFFQEKGLSEKDSYARCVRVFRGSTALKGPFTKDLVYNKGFILIYNYIRLSIQKGLLSRIPLLFLGKTTLEDLKTLEDLVAEKVVVMPKYIPEQFKDLAALSSWMCYSLFLNQLDLKRLAQEYKGIL